MKLARFVDLDGTIDGVNRDFTVPSAYLPVDPDSERLFWRGLPRVKSWDDGWTVVDYPTGLIRMNEAPESGDAPPALLFLQDLGDVVTGEVTLICGFVRKEVELKGGVRVDREVKACATREVKACPGKIRQLSVRGCVSVERTLTGKVGCCE